MSRAGLCADCEAARPVVTSRGGAFVLCTRSESDPRFEKYPSLPMLECPGYLAKGAVG